MPEETTTDMSGRNLETSPYGVTWASQAALKLSSAVQYGWIILTATMR